MIIAGAIVLGVGALTLAIGAAYASMDWGYYHDIRETYTYTFLIGGGIMVAVGLPLLIVGVSQRSQYSRWRMGNPVAAGLIEGLQVGASQRTAAFGWQTSF